MAIKRKKKRKVKPIDRSHAEMKRQAGITGAKGRKVQKNRK